MSSRRLAFRTMASTALLLGLAHAARAGDNLVPDPSFEEPMPKNQVGHVFKLGRKYSEAMGAAVLDEAGQKITMYMGCYGIGVTRVVAAAIEQNNDAAGIIWPDPIAPFGVLLVPMNWAKSERVREVAERLYAELTAAGLEPLLDDRDARPGVKFADGELWGIPHRIVIGERGLDKGELEYRHRRATDNEVAPLEGLAAFLRARIDAAGGTVA